jgi:hypothetical protein
VTTATATITTAMVREAFPNPVTPHEIKSGPDDPSGPSCYDVGGALLLYLTRAIRREDILQAYHFPPVETLASGLAAANPRIGDLENRMIYALRITKACDRGDFKAAWDALDDALTYDKEATP